MILKALSLSQRLEDLNLAGKTVLLRLDLNVPMHGGRVTDMMRIQRVLPGIRMLAEKKAKVVILSHFGRPEGEYKPSMSLSPLVDALQDILPGIRVRFGVDCVGPAALEAVKRAEEGQVLLLENLRFHPEEEAGDEAFAKELAALGDFYVNDAFSCSHRAHASIYHLPRLLPSCMGLSMRQEIATLEGLFIEPERPLMAIVGGSKISTKLELLERLVEKVDRLVIGGAMAHGFLKAMGHNIGASYCEDGMSETALAVIAKAKAQNCELLLPVDLIVAPSLAGKANCDVVPVEAIPEGMMALDIGPQTVQRLAASIASCKTLIWNGPLGAFETAPYDNSTVFLARVVAGLTSQSLIRSVAGGGDTVAALSHAGLADRFSYCSTAGGAFLEWLEGKLLPGIAALQAA